jgi:hypothetical protein
MLAQWIVQTKEQTLSYTIPAIPFEKFPICVSI